MRSTLRERFFACASRPSMFPAARARCARPFSCARARARSLRDRARERGMAWLRSPATYAMSAIGFALAALCIAAHARARAADARRAREPAARVEPLGRPGSSGRQHLLAAPGFANAVVADESGRARCAAGRREDLHRLPSARERALHAHAARARPARGEQGGSEHSGLRDLPRSGLRARAAADRRRA